MTAPAPPRPGRALCGDGRDTDDWHPEGDRRSQYVVRAYARAARVCQVCPIRLECLRSAVEDPEHWCMRAGLTPKQLSDDATVAALLCQLEQQRGRVVARA